MKVCLTILFIIISCFVFGQTSYLKDAVIKLDKALVTNDTTILKQLLHKSVTYGHSNGWVETKSNVINDLVTGKLVYHKIETDSVLWKADGDWASMRNRSKVEVSLNGTKMNLTLHVLQVWLKTNKGWQLIARQSTKIN